MYNNKQIGFGEATLVTGGTLAPVTLVIDVVLAAIPFIISAINRGKPNPNDWQGWNALDSKNRQPIGTSVVYWILNDGDSIQNEALNILSEDLNSCSTIVAHNLEFDYKVLGCEFLRNGMANSLDNKHEICTHCQGSATGFSFFQMIVLHTFLWRCEHHCTK